MVYVGQCGGKDHEPSLYDRLREHILAALAWNRLGTCCPHNTLYSWIVHHGIHTVNITALQHASHWSVDRLEL